MSVEELYRKVQLGQISPSQLNETGKAELRAYIEMKNAPAQPKPSLLERAKTGISNLIQNNAYQAPQTPTIDRISQGSPIQLSNAPQLPNAPQLARAHSIETPKQSEIAQGLQSGAWSSAIGKMTQSKYNPTSPQNMVKLGEFVSSKLPDGKVKDYVDSRTDAYEEQGQRVADLQNFKPTTIAGKVANIAGTIGGDLPLWAVGYGTVGQAVTKVPQVARLGKLSQEAVRGASVGATVSPIESAVHGDDLKTAAQRAALNIGAGAVLDPAVMKLGNIISNVFKAKPTATIDEIVEAVAKETNIPPTPELVKQVEDTIKLLPAPQNFTMQGYPDPYVRPMTYADMPSQVKRTPLERELPLPLQFKTQIPKTSFEKPVAQPKIELPSHLMLNPPTRQGVLVDRSNIKKPFQQQVRLGKQKVEPPLQFKTKKAVTDFEPLKAVNMQNNASNKPIEPLLQPKNTNTLPSRETGLKTDSMKPNILADEFSSKISRDVKPEKKTLSETYQKIRTQFVDDLAPLEQLEKSIKGTVSEADKSVYKMARLFKGSPTKADEIVRTKLQPVIQEIESAGYTYKDLGDYALAVHARDVNAQGINSGFTNEQINAVLSKFSNAELENARKKLIQISRESLEDLVDAQVITNDTLNALTEKWPNYMPLFRSFDDNKVEFAGGFKQALANVTSPIKKLEGSSRDVIDPIESMVKNIFQITNTADRNRVALQLAKLSEFDVDGQFIRQLADSENVGRKNVVSVLQNGEKVRYEVQPEVYKAMLNLDKESSNLMVSLLQKPASLLRAGATLTPEFSLRNPMRDIAQAYMVSNSGFKPWEDFSKALASVLKKDELYSQWLKDNGGYGNMMSMDRKMHREALEKVIKQPASKTFVNIINGKSLISLLRAIADAGESATKLGEYRAALRSGVSRKEAAYRSRDIMDFARAGYSTREANKMVAFLNANIQGKSKLIRVIKDDPTGVTVRGLKAVTLPTIAIFAAQKTLANDAQKRTIDDAPDWMKNVFWLLPVPGTDVVARIPKPFDIAPIFANMPERFMEYAYDNDPKAFEGFFGATLGDASIPVMITGLAPILEGIANYSFFRQAPIIPRREESLEYADQKDVNTTESAKFIAKGVEKLTGGQGPFKNFSSPRVVDNTIRGYTAGLGDYANTAIDFIVEGLRKEESKVERPAKDITQQPLLKAFLVNRVSTGKSVEFVYSKKNELQRQINSAKKNNELQGLGEQKRQLDYLNKATKRIGDISNQMRAIQNSNRMTGEEKRKELDRLNKIRNDIAIEARNKIN